MNYCELTVSEKAELRERLFLESVDHDGYTDFDYLSAQSKEIVNDCEAAEDIPEEIMEEAYGMYDFVEEDFFCDTEDQFCDRCGKEKTF